MKSVGPNVAGVILRKFKSKDLPGFEIATKFNIYGVMKNRLPVIEMLVRK